MSTCVLYDGIGCGSKTQFTEDEFLKIMNDNVTHKDWKNVPEFVKTIQLNFKDWVLPDDFIFFTTEDWIEYSGARKVDSDGDRTRNL